MRPSYEFGCVWEIEFEVNLIEGVREDDLFLVIGGVITILA